MERERITPFAGHTSKTDRRRSRTDAARPATIPPKHTATVSRISMRGNKIEIDGVDSNTDLTLVQGAGLEVDASNITLRGSKQPFKVTDSIVRAKNLRSENGGKLL